MTKLNYETFKFYKQKFNLTNKAIAELARVDERTVGKIKKGGDLNPASADRIASALKKTVEELQSAVTKEEEKISRILRKDQEITALNYGVGIDWMIQNAHLFFAYVAEDFLKDRRQKLEKNKQIYKELFSSISGKTDIEKRVEEKSIDLNAEVESPYIDLHEIFYDEKTAIDDWDLRGPKVHKNQNDLFVDWFYNAECIEDVVYYKEDDNLSLEDFSDICFQNSALFRGVDKFLRPPENYKGPIEDYDTTDDLIPAGRTPEGYSRAYKALNDFDPYILTSEIPISYRKPENYSKMLVWLKEEHERRIRAKESNADE